MMLVFLITAVCLVAPVNGPIVAGYSPASEPGHWGVDYGTGPGEAVLAPVSGGVTFAGSVAGMLSVTVQPVPGFKVSVSFLSDIVVSEGTRVRRGQVLGRAGRPHGAPGVHLSTRIDGRYVDPATQMGCFNTDISRALRLLPPPQSYPRSRAHRNPRRDLRPRSHRPSPRRRDRAAPSGTGPGALHARRGPLAEGGPSRNRRPPPPGDGSPCRAGGARVRGG
ncbi:MAG TPA: M23 family metallopeptidase [Acidimicrobiia bacterium]|nr:M23 family metallopeptidase [Acidimicrobiia bacterium]